LEEGGGAGGRGECKEGRASGKDRGVSGRYSETIYNCQEQESINIYEPVFFFILCSETKVKVKSKFNGVFFCRN
jgi:hypothetical protein